MQTGSKRITSSSSCMVNVDPLCMLKSTCSVQLSGVGTGLVVGGQYGFRWVLGFLVLISEE